MAGSSGEKTEKPTPKRRKESRKEGQVARTQELGAWVTVLGAGMAAPMLVSRELERMRELLTTSMVTVQHADASTDLVLLGEALRHVFTVLVVLGAGVMVVGVASSLAQGGFYLATKSVRPKLSKLSLLQGAKRVLGPHALWEGAKMLVKSSLVGLLAWSAIKAMMPLTGSMLPIPSLIHETTGHVLGLIRNVAMAGLVLAAADYAMAKRRTDKQTRMTKDEVKQEHKQAEGDPLVKSAIRSRQLAAARNRMMADVVTADVVLVNPTHVAVALRYDSDKGAPRVVARGAGVVAARIREIATEARVPLVQDVPLARALYSSSEVGHEIPVELFAAVAQVLAFVIRRRTLGQHGGQHRSPRVETEVPATPVRGRRRRTASSAATAARTASRPAGSHRAIPSGAVLAGR
ncbi:MAG: EscU/YscU/HrcU family type III secretion system export apparatus switch protein [Marmoricola sp.]